MKITEDFLNGMMIGSVVASVIILLIAAPAMAADGDITQTEVVPDVVKWELDTVRFLVITRTV